MACGDCIVHQIGSAEFTERLAGRDGAGVFPIAGSLELTLDCNLWCRHCYIRYPGATENEMGTEEVKAILDKLADKGVLFLLLTGGEIFARPDFREIYLYARRKGFLLTLFSNATLVDEDLAAFLAAHPPRRIEITIYGHTEETYERITGIEGSYRRFRRGVELLLARGLNVFLKMMVMRSNQHEFESVRHWAEVELGRPFRFDSIINPRLDGHRGVLRERLPPADVVRLEASGGGSREEFERLRALAANPRPDGRLFRCGAGIRTFHIDPRGQMHPCMMWRSTPYDALRRPLDGGWQEHVTDLRAARRPEDSSCTGCVNSFACGNCAATSALEVERAGTKVPYYCAINREREKFYRLEPARPPVRRTDPAPVADVSV
jgi:radical SAM protein with 4Fe4S-binding SPASM domain